jgi:hypothetical protein
MNVWPNGFQILKKANWLWKSWDLSWCHDIIYGGCGKKLRRFHTFFLRTMRCLETIPEHFEPGPGPRQAHPRTLLDGRGKRSWSPRKVFLARAQPEMLFLVVLHYKIRGRPAPSPSPARKLRPDTSSGMAMGRIFSARNNINFFQPDPNPARPEPGLARKMLRSIRNRSI